MWEKLKDNLKMTNFNEQELAKFSLLCGIPTEDLDTILISGKRNAGVQDIASQKFCISEPHGVFLSNAS